MSDYKEEQNNEVEALESIYPDEFEVISSQPLHNFQITISSDATDEGEDEENAERLVVTLDITYTASYPDEAPLFQVIPKNMIGDSHVEQLKALIQEEIEQNLGMAMVFTLVSAVQEFLNERVDDIKKEREEELERQEEAARIVEEERTNKLKGTPVTIESFLAWKEKFDAEVAERRNAKVQIEKAKGLTGKELFLRDTTLDTSDMALLDEGDKVEVDESLFQELDDLDLDEDLDDLS